MEMPDARTANSEKQIMALEQPLCFVECLRLDHEGLNVAIVRNETKITKYLLTLDALYPEQDVSRSTTPVAQDTPKSSIWNMFMIHQVYGRGPPSLSNQGIRQLQSWARQACSINQPTAQDTSILDEACSVFESKSFSKDEALGSFTTNFFKSQHNTTLPVELCYLLKYAARHEDNRDGINPWSIRQAMIYQCLHRKNDRNACITVRLSDDMQSALQRKLEDETERQTFKQDPRNLHTLLFEESLGQWRPFINMIDEQLTAISDEVILSHFADDQTYLQKSTGRLRKLMKRLQYLQDQISRIKTMLRLNSKIAARLRTILGTLVVVVSPESDSGATPINSTSEPARDDSGCTLYETAMDDIVHRHDMLIESVSCVHERALMVSTKLHEALQLLNGARLQHTTESTSQANKSMVQLMQSMSCANDTMADLMERSASEARTMKILTVVALFYVPSSFAADFLQMGYVSVTSYQPFRVSSTDDLTLYFVIAVPLILATFLLGMFVPWLSSRQWSTSDAEQGGKGRPRSLWNRFYGCLT